MRHGSQIGTRPPEFKTTQMAQKRTALERSAKAFAERYEELLEQYPNVDDPWGF